MIFGGVGLNPPLGFQPPPPGCPCGGWEYHKMKIKIIFEYPTNENPSIDITHDFL